jgi:hypothetical protein
MDFHDFFDLFVNGAVEMGSYFNYMREWGPYIKKHAPNSARAKCGKQIFLLEYEQLLKDPLYWIQNLVKFLDLKNSSDEAALQEVVRATTIAKMKDEGHARATVSAHVQRGSQWHVQERICRRLEE